MFWGGLDTMNLGCSLCEMIEAILRDARQKQCMTEPKERLGTVEVLRKDDRFLMILNNSELNWRSKEHVVVYQGGRQIPPLRLVC